MKIGFPAHDVLKEVSWNKLFLKVIRILAEFIHTGVFECYVEFLGDGDSKDHNLLVQENAYGEVEITRPECVGHIQNV